MVMERKVLLAEPEGGDLHAEDRELRVLRHQANCLLPHTGPPDACRQNFGFSKVATLVEPLENL